MGRGFDEDMYVCTAWLHDVVEDSSITLDDLTGMGFEEEVIYAVDALTKRNGETYEQFIQRADKSVVARIVKRADIEDHLAQPNAREFHKYSKYVAALETLTR
jgi:(p)ppGpp synthase/HD superfamily hydrolase